MSRTCKKPLHAIALGIRRHPFRFLAEVFLGYCAIWTLVESTSFFFSKIKLQGAHYYLGVVTLGFLIACARVYPRRSIQFKVGHSNTKIAVSFGDIFQHDGHIAIPANEYFDSELGLPVSPKSLHGLVINHFFGGYPDSFDKLVASDLAGTQSDQVQRTGGKTARFAIGTTASIRTNSHRFLFFALSTTDVKTFKASASLPDLVRALEGLCAKARLVLGGEKLVVPLVGSGLSGIGLPANQLLQLILLILVNETKKNQFALEIEVVVHPTRYDEVDLSSIESFWR